MNATEVIDDAAEELRDEMPDDMFEVKDAIEDEQPEAEAAKPEPPKQDADALLKQIEALEEECYLAELEWEDRKSEAKVAKELYEAKVGALRRLIRSAKNDADRPLLKQAEAAANEEMAIDDAWRETPIEELALGAGPEKHLREAGITTIGKLADFTSQERANLTDIAGIGSASAEKISDRLMSFWVEHPEYCDNAEEAE